MKLIAPLAFATLAASALAQSPAPFTDPANLRGERVAASDGRELPVDTSEALGGHGLQQMLRKLSTRASLMLIVAHPDDEDSGMLTFYSRGMGARAAMLTLNRGEGGQNAMTGDFEDALGLLRTQELLAEDRYSGVTQMFGTEVDFGFSKTKEEAFAKWTHERVLYDAVRAVRLYRPLVIAAVFIGGVTDGHGQHQVSGEIAQEVFKAAGDPKVFPELTAEGILPWQPLKVYARVPTQAITQQGLFDYATGQYTAAHFENYVTGEVTTNEPSVNVVVHEGNIDPILGPYPAKEPFVSYVQFAREGLSLQKSQIGPGMRTGAPGAFDVNYHRYGSRLAAGRQKLEEDSFFDGIDTSLEGIATLAPGAPLPLHDHLRSIATLIHTATTQLNANDVAAIAPMLAEALKQTDTLIGAVEAAKFANAEEKADVLHEVRIKRVQLNQALVLSLGLTLDAAGYGANQVQGEAISTGTTLKEVSSEPLSVGKMWLTTAQGAVPEKTEATELTAAHAVQKTLTAPAAYTVTITRPYFYRDNIEAPVYQLRMPDLRNAPQTPPALTAWAQVEYHGAKIELGRVVHAGPQPVQIVPPVSVAFDAHAQALASTASQLRVGTIIAPSPGAAGEAPVSESLGAPRGWKQVPQDSNELASEPGHAIYVFEVPSAGREPVTLKATSKLANGHVISEGYRSVGYGDLPRTNYFTPATDKIVPVDLKLPTQTRIGYLPGTGDDVPAALVSIGLRPEMLTVADLTPERLAHYDTVILGVRTYSAHAELHGKPTQALLDYARGGGNVVVQYQTAGFAAEDAPYPVTLGRYAQTVVDETAPVVLLGICDNINPPHTCEQSQLGSKGMMPGSISDYSLLTTPNVITPADFNGWVEERGHGFLSTWDAHYTVLTEVHDPGQEPQKGGLVTVKLGKGRWTYVAFALYRQLPEAVPGSYRLLMNLLQPPR